VLVAVAVQREAVVLELDAVVFVFALAGEYSADVGRLDGLCSERPMQTATLALQLARWPLQLVVAAVATTRAHSVLAPAGLCM